MLPRPILPMLTSDAIVQLHDELTRAWHDDPADPVDPESTEWLARVARHHRANFDLWHIEDEARTPGVSDGQLAEVKRRIDSTNQLRNDLMEQLDQALLDYLEPQLLPDADAPLHSESPGLMIDRLSILALKIYHTREEALRIDAPPGHANRNQGRLEILEIQRADLAHCLDVMWRETLDGSRRFKIYRQMKMYNDPTLNPAIYLNTPDKCD